MKNNEYFMWVINIGNESHEDISVDKSSCLTTCIQFLESYIHRQFCMHTMLKNNLRNYLLIFLPDSIQFQIYYFIHCLKSICDIPLLLSVFQFSLSSVQQGYHYLVLASHNSLRTEFLSLNCIIIPCIMPHQKVF